jgi:hypothetical protein
MSNFSSVLNKYCEGFMVLELNFSFLGSFYDSFYGPLLYIGFPYELIYEFEPPTSLNGSRFLTRASMRRKILQYMSVNFSFSLANISFVGS